MRSVVLIAFFFSFHTYAAEPRSFDLLLTGKTAAGPHPNEEAAIRKLVAGAVENLKVKKYLLRPKLPYGGFRVCLEPVEEGGYDYIAGELSVIGIRESVWDIQLVRRCRD